MGKWLAWKTLRKYAKFCQSHYFEDENHTTAICGQWKPPERFVKIQEINNLPCLKCLRWTMYHAPEEAKKMGIDNEEGGK